mmetsp:Transcript_128658/g.222262  ORF Transcript_128658/g.222262 Transcript_128658/m.222262 type:complete len:243 (-) Transcript_128658:789-1517(-)
MAPSSKVEVDGHRTPCADPSTQFTFAIVTHSPTPLCSATCPCLFIYLLLIIGKFTNPSPTLTPSLPSATTTAASITSAAYRCSVSDSDSHIRSNCNKELDTRCKKNAMIAAWPLCVRACLFFRIPLPPKDSWPKLLHFPFGVSPPIFFFTLPSGARPCPSGQGLCPLSLSQLYFTESSIISNTTHFRAILWTESGPDKKKEPTAISPRACVLPLACRPLPEHRLSQPITLPLPTCETCHRRT